MVQKSLPGLGCIKTCKEWHIYHMSVSKNRGGPPKWMCYKGKPYKNWWFRGTPILETPILTGEFAGFLNHQPSVHIESWEQNSRGFSEVHRLSSSPWLWPLLHVQPNWRVAVWIPRKVMSPQSCHNLRLFAVQCKSSDVCSAYGTYVDGSEIPPKNQLMCIGSLIPVFVEFYASQVVQGFWTINSMNI